MKNVADYQAFEAGLTVLLDSATGLDIGDDRLCELLVDYLDEQMQRWRAGIDRDYASRAFHEHLQNKGRGSIAECVLEWAEGCANDIRWPLAFVYFATGKLPGEYRENTTVVVVVEDRKGKIVGHQVIHWCDYAHIEDNAERYGAFNRAIDKCAIDLGARSIFDFHCAARLHKSVSVAHDLEQGWTIFSEREYR